jgi:hypothetical protein
MAKNRNKERGGFWFLLLLSLPFAGVALGFLALSIIPSLHEWQVMKGWQPVQAELQSVELIINEGDRSASYQALASYQYQVKGQNYVAARVGIMSGSDNIGDWQQDRARELKARLKNNQGIVVYVNPNNNAEAIIYRDLRWGMLGFKMIFVVLLGCVGFGLMYSVFFSRKKRVAQSALTRQEPWLQEPDWANPISSGTGTGLVFLVFLAVIWNTISAPLLFLLPDEVREGNKVALVGFLFPLIGTGLIILCVVQFIRWRRFGDVRLTLDPWPGVIGGYVSGYTELPLSRAENPRVLVTLSCLHCYYTGSGKHRRRIQKPLWQTEGIATLAVASNATRVSFVFKVPSDLPASEPSDDNYHQWRVILKANLAGADLNLSYEIPVFPASAQTVSSSTLRVHLSDEHPELVAHHEQNLENLLNIKQLPGGVALSFGYFRNALTNSTLLLFGLIFSGAAVMMWHKDAPVAMALICGLVGGGIFLIGLYKLFNAYQVKLGERGIFTERYFMGVLIKKRFIERNAIMHLAIKSQGSSQAGSKHTEHFVINAKLHDGREIRVAESLNGRALTERALESLAMLSGIKALS